MHPVFEQMIYYLVVMVLGWFFVGFIQRGFFLRYVRVKLSFGRLIMVKIRALNRDYFRIGKTEEGFLVFKGTDGHRRISIKDRDVFYRVMGTIWVDVDDEKGALVKPNFSTVTGFDAEKYDNLYKRTLYKPAIADNKDKIIFGALVILLIVTALAVVLAYKNSTQIDAVIQAVNSLKESSIQMGGI